MIITMNPLRRALANKRAAEVKLQGFGEKTIRPALKKAVSSFNAWGAKRQAKFTKDYKSGVRY